MEQKFVSNLDFIGHMLGNIEMDVKAGNDWGLGRLWKIWPCGPVGKHELIFASRIDSSSRSTSKSTRDLWTNLLPEYYTSQM